MCYFENTLLNVRLYFISFSCNPFQMITLFLFFCVGEVRSGAYAEPKAILFTRALARKIKTCEPLISEARKKKKVKIMREKNRAVEHQHNILCHCIILGKYCDIGKYFESVWGIFHILLFPRVKIFWLNSRLINFG